VGAGEGPTLIARARPIAYIGDMSPFRALRLLLDLLFPKMSFVGNGIKIVEPAIFVANHEGAFGPLALILRFPLRLYPWVMHDLTERERCARYLESHYFSTELGLPRFAGAWISHLIAELCVGLFRHIEAIPVYHESRRIMETIAKSIVYLEEGRSLLIFPEIPDSYLNRYIGRFNTGFIEIAKRLGREERRIVDIYPVAVDRRGRRIILGHPSSYDVTKAYPEERRRIEGELEEELSAMLAR